jgi:enterochelin esterase-like enzyme
VKVRSASEWPKGQIVTLEHTSRVLQGNPWDDPVCRPLSVYLPPGHNEHSGALPALWSLAAYTNSGPGQLNWRNQGETLSQRLDRLIHQGALGPCAVVIPDCFTSLGGNQYVNSTSVGAYADYLVQELVPFVSEHFNVADNRNSRAAFGKSSGAYGALVHAMYYPDTWGAVACHAPDIQFEMVYRPDFPKICATLAAHDYDIGTFLRYFWRANKPDGYDYLTLMIMCMAASYDPDPGSEPGFTLPFDLHTCELDPDRWARWLQHDPIHLLDRYADNLRQLHGLYLDVGNRDQYNIHYGMRIFHRQLEDAGIPHFFEEFDGTHSGIDYRLDYSLAYLYKALNTAAEPAQ